MITWHDIRAFMFNLPDTSHFMRNVNPKRAEAAEWLTPTNQLLGHIYDLELQKILANSGESLDDYVGVISRMVNGDESSGEPKKRSKKTPAQIREQLGLER